MSDGLFQIVADGHYRLAFPASGVEFTCDRLRRERHELHCELSVACGIVGAKAIDGVLSVGTFNLSSPTAAQQRAKLLAERARTTTLDWASMLEELRQRVLQAERGGEPSLLLRDVAARPEATDEYQVLGLTFPRHHPSILFGDGGTCKSLLALRIASEVEGNGGRVGYFDWELNQFTHRRRLEAINGTSMPATRYVRCDRPLTHEVDRLRRTVHTHGLTYTVMDSVAYGTAGAPESAEAAMDYSRAARQIGTGSLWLAHQNRAETGDQRPFGSTFWYNSARCVWNIKLASTSPDGQTLQLAAFHRKSNLGRLQPPVGIKVVFDDNRVFFSKADVTQMHEVAASLPLWQRIRGVVASGPQTVKTIASELGHDNVESVDRVIRRHKDLFTRVTGGDGVTRIDLFNRRAS